MTKQIMTAFAAFVLLALALPAMASANYLPLNQGDTAVYEGEVVDGSTELDMRDTRITSVQGNWRRFSDFLGTGPRWVWSDGTEIFILNNDGNSASRLLNANASVGTQFTASLNSCIQGGTMAEKDLSLNLAGVTALNVIRLDFNNVCGEGLKSAWFAPGMGVVKWMDAPAYMNLERHYFRLAAGRVNGQSYPRKVGNTEINFHLAGGHTVISSGNPVSELPVWVEVNNISDYDQTLRFSSSQIMEVEIFDDNGELVKRWSEGHSFSQALVDKTLPAGESRWFGKRVRLQTNNGEPLDLSTYEVRVTFKGHPTASNIAGVYSDNGYFSKTIPLHLDYSVSVAPGF